MERHNVWRANTATATPAEDHLRQERARTRYRPARRPVAIDRPREEQTWPTQLVLRSTSPRMTADDAHPDWPGQRRPPAPVYQRRLDRHTDGIVRSFRVHQDHRTVSGRRRGMTTHRRPLAIVGDPVVFGRGSDAHYRTLFSGAAPQYRRLRIGGNWMSGHGMGEMMSGIVQGLRGTATVSPRRAVIAMVAVVVLLMGAMGTGLAQQRYVVQQGDTVDSIAETFGVNPDAIRRSSYLPTGDQLQAGQVLVIPDRGQSPSDAAEMAAELEGTSPWVSTAHWVEPGETIASIATDYGLDPATLVEFNGISDPAGLMPGDRILVPSTGEASHQSSSEASSAVTVPGVGTYYQRHNLSCEYAAAHIATDAFGNGIDESVFIDTVPSAQNPHNGYRGNIDGWWGNTDDYGVYAEPLVPVLNEYGFAGEVLYTEGDTAPLKAHIDAGHPVVVWLGFWGDTREYLSDAGEYSVAAGMHVVTAYGYDDNGVYVSDPASGSFDYYSWEEFVTMWKVLDGMSLAIYPA